MGAAAITVTGTTCEWAYAAEQSRMFQPRAGLEVYGDGGGGSCHNLTCKETAWPWVVLNRAFEEVSEIAVVFIHLLALSGDFDLIEVFRFCPAGG